MWDSWTVKRWQTTSARHDTTWCVSNWGKSHFIQVRTYQNQSLDKHWTLWTGQSVETTGQWPMFVKPPQLFAIFLQEQLLQCHVCQFYIPWDKMTRQSNATPYFLENVYILFEFVSCWILFIYYLNLTLTVKNCNAQAVTKKATVTYLRVLTTEDDS